MNVATWLMVFVLDFLGLVLAYKGGNKEPYMQLGWAIAAALTALAVLLNGSPFVWGLTEQISVLLAVVATYLWLTKGPLVAQWAYMVAVSLSLVPQAVDYWYHPQPETLWVWQLTAAGCLFAVLGAEKKDFAHTFVPWGACVLNAIFVYILVR